MCRLRKLKPSYRRRKNCKRSLQTRKRHELHSLITMFLKISHKNLIYTEISTRNERFNYSTKNYSIKKVVLFLTYKQTEMRQSDENKVFKMKQRNAITSLLHQVTESHAYLIIMNSWTPEKVDKGDKKKKVGGGGEAKTKRKEELQKQLKAVEDAIRRKRTKLDK